MSSDRIQRKGNRSGVMGWWDNIRYNEILRQGIGLLLVAVCAYFARGEVMLVIIGLAVAAFGQVFRIYAAGFIHKNKQLASTGPYALVRHPLYLGNFLILFGFALAANNLYVETRISATQKNLFVVFNNTLLSILNFRNNAGRTDVLNYIRIL